MTEDFQNVSEKDLAAKASAGVEAAFNEIVRRYSPRVFRVARRFFRTESLIEEAAQEIFLKAFVQIGKYEARGSLEGWVTRIAVTVCINLKRGSKQYEESSAADLNSDEILWLQGKLYHASATKYQNEQEQLIAADLVKRILAVLPPEDALVLTLMDGEGESVKDVARMTGWSESKVKIRAFRARRRIRETLQIFLPDEQGNYK